MKKNKLLILSILLFLFIGLTGCDDKAKPTPDTNTEYTVTFDAGTGGTLTSAATVKVKSGEKVAKPTDPTRDGFAFVEWRKTGATTAFNFATETITANITLTAQWGFTVTFAGENVTTPPQIVPDGGMATPPPTPTRVGFTFVEWQTDNGSPFSFNTAINADITLTAEWRAITLTVTFVGESINIQPQPVAYGGMATRPATDPTRDGFTFFNWYKEAMFNELYDFSTAVTVDVTVYARWLSNTKYTVTFKPNQGVLAGGNDNNTVQISEGEKLPKPIDPTRADHTFVEWQKEDDTAFDFDTETITAPITLTATWADAVGSLADVAIVLNDANTAYEVNYKYTNAAGGTTGGTLEVTWFLSDNANGTAPTQVSMEATYTLEDKNRYNKYLVASVRVMAAGGFTETVRKVRSPGFSTEATRGATNTRFSGRDGHTSVRFKEKIWVIGGYDGDYKDDVWSSADGITWIQAPAPTTPSQRFSERNGHTSVVFKDAIWVIGGSSEGRKNDVWSSEDGSNWVKKADATAQNPRFSERDDHTSVAFKGSIWVIGGYDGKDKNDVWSSKDGVNWKQVTNPMTGAAFSPRYGHSSVVFNNKIWVIGGYGLKYFNDVWSSEDGANWTQVTPADTGAPFSTRLEHTSVIFDGKIWVIGGNSKNDVWSSENGRDWIEYSEMPEKSRFSQREQHTSVASDDKKKIWVIGGNDGSRKNDVWY